MPRTIDEGAHAARRNAILDAAQRLIFTKGYEQMTVQDLLDALDMSKGAFYHYFASKVAVLDALMDRVIDEMEQVLLPIVHDPTLDAITKLQRFFSVSVRWKTMRREFLGTLARVLYADENVLYRQKTRVRSIAMTAPLLGDIIHQGIREGVMDAAYPDLAGEMVMALLLDMGDSLVPTIFEHSQQVNGCLYLPHTLVAQVTRIFAAYTDALERIIGAHPGSLTLVDAETLRLWEAPSEAPAEERQTEESSEITTQS